MTTTTLHKIAVIGGAALLALALAAAGAAQASGAPTTAASYVPPTDSMSGQSMLEILIRNSRDAIRQSRAVIASSSSAELRRFAQATIDERSASLNSANALWDRLGYTRGDTTTTLPSPETGMGAGAVTATAADQTYLSAQSSALESVVTQLQQRKNFVTDPTVRAFALEAQASLERQLAEVKRLQAPTTPVSAPAPATPPAQ